MERSLRLGGLLLVTTLVVVATTQVAQALPGYGICSDCHGASPELQTTPIAGGILDFGNVLVGESANRDITVQNPVRQSGLIGEFPAGSGEFAPQTTAPFTTEYEGQLIRGRTAMRAYTYTPSARGADSLPVTVTSNAGNSAITFTGRGVAPVVSLDATAADAGNVRIGTSGIATLRVNNIGDGNLAGPGKGNLVGSVAVGSGGFTGPGGTVDLPDGGSIAFPYDFTPTSHGLQSASVGVNMTNGSTDGTNRSQLLEAVLSGTGVGPTFESSLLPGSLIDFGEVAAGGSALRMLTAGNATADLDLGPLTNLTLLAAQIDGPGAGGFSLLDFTAGTILSKSSSSDLQISFHPSDPGALSQATLTLLTDQGVAFGSPGAVYSFDLTGVSAVPEPSTLLMLGIVGLCLGWYWRRRAQSGC